MRDQLGLHAEAGRQHDPALDSRDGRAQPLGYGFAADQVDRGGRRWVERGDGRGSDPGLGEICVGHSTPLEKYSIPVLITRYCALTPRQRPNAELESVAEAINSRGEDNIDVAQQHGECRMFF